MNMILCGHSCALDLQSQLFLSPLEAHMSVQISFHGKQIKSDLKQHDSETGFSFSGELLLNLVLVL